MRGSTTGSMWRRFSRRGKFDGLFIADVLGVYDVYGGNVDTALKTAAQLPLNDPVLLIPPMARVTKISASA